MAGCAPYLEPAGPGQIPPGAVTHRVAQGETLWRIARRYGVAVQGLVQANRISDASRIHTGEILVIPPAPKAHGPEGSRDIGEDALSQEEFVWPVQGHVVSVFGMRRGATLNKGIDIQANWGADIVAARAGVVSFVHEDLPGFGKTIIVDHRDGFATVYAYIDQILVHPGETVTQRQVIGKVGTTGRTEVPALHFEIRHHQKPRNPFHYLP